jgi:thiol:disulfide interchange protein DsbD
VGKEGFWWVILGKSLKSINLTPLVDRAVVSKYNYAKTTEVGLLRCLCVVAALLVASSSFATDDLPEPGSIVTPSGHVSFDAVHPGMSFEIALACSILEDWHINSHTPAEDAFVATEVSFDLPEWLDLRDVRYPEGVEKKFSFSEEPLSVYEGDFVIVASVVLSDEAPASEISLEYTLRYQACNDKMCLEPVEKELAIPLRIVGSDTPIRKNELDIFKTEAQPHEGPTGFGSGNVVLTFLFVFIGGLALNLTPCIYPMIPITISYFGGQSQGSQRRLFALGIVYVLGIALTYSVAGLVASLTGSLLGAAMQSPLVLAFVAVVLVALALSMFDVYALRMPAGLARATGSSKGGFFGSLFMGLTLGIVVAPCVGPFVLGLLTYVGRLGNPVLGFWMFFTLAFGMGLPLIVLGVLSGSLKRLPRSGDWMIWVKKVFGFILLAMALYFLRTMIPGPVYWTILALLTLCAGIYLGWVEKVKAMGRGFSFLRKLFAFLSMLLVIWLVVAPGHTFIGRRGESLAGWQPYSESLLSDQVGTGRPILVDFCAEWCIPCGELEERTFSDRRVKEKASSFLLLKVDVTAGASEEAKALMSRYNVVGVPTVVFLTDRGKELEDLSFVGFIGPDSLVVLMGKALSAGERKVGGN